MTIDGAYGEGGGQILRSTLALAAVTGRAVRIDNIRARRAKPGLAAQHLATVRALAALCEARLDGDALDSTTLSFAPRREVRAGRYDFDIAAVRAGGSAGSTSLVLQAVVPALARAGGRSTITVKGGTHVAFSPSFDYLRDVWLHALVAMGLDAKAELVSWGWYPAGQGEVRVDLEGLAGGTLRPIDWRERPPLDEVWGRAVVARIPFHVPARMVARAALGLGEAGIAPRLEAQSWDAVSPGAGIFLNARYGPVRAGFGALGKRGKPAEAVADEAVAALLAYHRTGAAADRHLGDQLVVPAALAHGPSRYSVEAVTGHLTTVAWLVERFALATVAIATGPDGTGLVTVTPRGGS